MNPGDAALTRGADGLFHMTDGSEAPSDATVTVSSGMLESSNVNIASAMVNMIELARRFDLQIKSMHTAEDDASSATKLLQSS